MEERGGERERAQRPSLMNSDLMRRQFISEGKGERDRVCMYVCVCVCVCVLRRSAANSVLTVVLSTNGLTNSAPPSHGAIPPSLSPRERFGPPRIPVLREKESDVLLSVYARRLRQLRTELGCDSID